MAPSAPARLTPRAGRRFAFSLAVAFLVVGGISYWRGRVVAAGSLGGLGVAFLAAGTLVPDRVGCVYAAWMAVGRGLSRMTTPIVLAILYFLVVTPIGLLLRLVGRDPLRHRPREGSYWARVPSGGRSNLNDQF